MHWKVVSQTVNIAKKKEREGVPVWYKDQGFDPIDYNENIIYLCIDYDSLSVCLCAFSNTYLSTVSY